MAVNISHHPQLFLDDYLIRRSENICRRVNQPVRHRRNPLIVPEHPWEKWLINFYGTVLYDEERGRFQCWYVGGDERGKVTHVEVRPQGPAARRLLSCIDDEARRVKLPPLSGSFFAAIGLSVGPISPQ